MSLSVMPLATSDQRGMPSPTQAAPSVHNPPSPGAAADVYVLYGQHLKNILKHTAQRARQGARRICSKGGGAGRYVSNGHAPRDELP